MERVLGAKNHDREHLVDEVERDLGVEQVAHAVDEHPAWLPPVHRLIESVGMTLHVGKSPLPPESVCYRLRIAVLAALGHFRAARDGIPGAVSPFD